MSYPDYQQNRLVINDVDLTEVYGLILVDGYTLSNAEPKFYTVDVPGGNGIIDLTEALSGDISYNSREFNFTLYRIYTDFEWLKTIREFTELKTKILSFLNGKTYDFRLTEDPMYLYTGRFEVSDSQYSNGLAAFTLKVTVEPYKTYDGGTGNKLQSYSISNLGTDVITVKCECGRLRVHPMIETAYPIMVTFNDIQLNVGTGGKFILNNVTFSEGTNELKLSTIGKTTRTWQDVYDAGYTWKNAGTWVNLAGTETTYSGLNPVTISWYRKDL